MPLSVDTFVVSYEGNVIDGIMARGTGPDGRLVQAYQWRSAGGDVIVDSLVSELSDLRPVHETRVVGDTLVQAIFGADSIRTSTPGGGTTFWIDKSTRAVLKYDTREGPATIAFRR